MAEEEKHDHPPEPNPQLEQPTPSIDQPPEAAPRIKIGSQRQQPPSISSDSTATIEAEKPDPVEPAPVEEKIPEQDVDTASRGMPFPPPRLDRTPSDLQSEIDAALGDLSMDRLMGVGSASVPAGEIEIDQRCLATVVTVHRDSVLFDLNGQHNGVASRKHFEQPPEPGTQLEVVVTGFSQEDQLYELIVPGASVSVADWSDLAEGVVVEARVTGHNKGGLECEVNHIRGFIPASQTGLYRVDDLSTLVDEKLQCVVTEANPQRRNLVLSRRAVLEREQEESRKKLLEELEVGQTREGVVRRLQDFGAFVDLGGIDGLIHISQLSWDRVNHPSEVLEEGQTVKVRVEKIDKASGRIGLSYRDLLYHPWEGIEAKYPIGAVVSGTVSKIMEFGAFVKLEPGVEGLVHISELSYKRVHKVQHVVQEGQEVQVKVLSVDPEAQRISLSIKAAQAEPVDTDSATDDGEEPTDVAASVQAQPKRPLRGGLGHDAGGEQFGLKW